MIDGNTFDGKFRKYVKKPVVVRAAQMQDDFRVTTLEGVMHGRKGDYLVIGIEGERYPVRKEIFERTYCIAEDTAVKNELTDIEKHKLFREMLQETYMTHRRKASLTDILFTLTHMRMVNALAKVGLKAMAVYGLTNLLEEEADKRWRAKS